MSFARIVLVSPVIFGLAHVHHFYEFRVTHPQVPLVAAIARSMLQFAYTTLFGSYATFLFLRTGSLLCVVLVHAFCNSMGLPRIWGAVQPYWARGTQQQVRSAKMLHTAVYYLLLVGGLYLWSYLLYPETESTLNLAALAF